MRALAPTILVLAACGRVGFDMQADGGAGDAIMDAADAMGAPVALAAYSFSEAAGTTAIDRTGNGNDLTAAFGAPVVTSSGHTGGGLTFSTNNDGFRKQMPSAALDVSAGFTLMGWMKPDVVPGGGESLLVTYIGRTPVRYPYGLIAFDHVGANGEPTCYVIPAGGGEVKAPGPAVLAANVWTHLACTYDNTEFRMYVNGVLVTTLPSTILAEMGVVQPELIVGNDSAGDQAFVGNIDDVRVYGRALSPTEIVNAMNTPVTP